MSQRSYPALFLRKVNGFDSRTGCCFKILDKNIGKNKKIFCYFKPEKRISFDFQLKAGPAITRNAIALLKVLDYPDKLVKNAKEEATFFDHNRTWRVLEKK